MYIPKATIKQFYINYKAPDICLYKSYFIIIIDGLDGSVITNIVHIFLVPIYIRYDWPFFPRIFGTFPKKN